MQITRMSTNNAANSANPQRSVRPVAQLHAAQPTQQSMSDTATAAQPSSLNLPTSSPPAPSSTCNDPQFRYIQYDSSKEAEYVTAMRNLISTDLSEPYSIYVYRYFLYQWGDLCFMALDDSNNLAGCVISKLETHRGGPLRGYIAMLAVQERHRGKGIATRLVRRAIDAMIAQDADEIALETETTNAPAIKLYERLGFLRSKRLHRYYLNGNSAFRLVLYLKEGVGAIPTGPEAMDPYAPVASTPPAPAAPSEAGAGPQQQQQGGDVAQHQQHLQYGSGGGSMPAGAAGTASARGGRRSNGGGGDGDGDDDDDMDGFPTREDREHPARHIC